MPYPFTSNLASIDVLKTVQTYSNFQLVPMLEGVSADLITSH